MLTDRDTDDLDLAAQEREAERDNDDIQVTIHGKYGQGPMPVEFRDALVEMVRLVKQAVDDGTLPARRSPAPGSGED